MLDLGRVGGQIFEAQQLRDLAGEAFVEAAMIAGRRY